VLRKRGFLHVFSLTVCAPSVSTQQIYTVVLEIRDSISMVDTRWTHFQAPYIVEDALGRKYPVPSEYDFAALDGLIHIWFRQGPGALEVSEGSYELLKSNRRSETVTAGSRLLPGTAITMAIVIGTKK